jgi:hypothetical protein
LPRLAQRDRVGDDDQSIQVPQGGGLEYRFRYDFSGVEARGAHEELPVKAGDTDFAYGSSSSNNPTASKRRSRADLEAPCREGERRTIAHLHGRTLQDEARMVLAKISKLGGRSESS